MELELGNEVVNSVCCLLPFWEVGIARHSAGVRMAKLNWTRAGQLECESLAFCCLLPERKFIGNGHADVERLMGS